MHRNRLESRGQVGIGTLAVFIAMVLVALIAGGVLIETTGLLQGKSSATGEQSSAQVTDRVGVESATASYSSGSMDSIDIVLSKAPGSGDIDLSEVVVHWLGPNGSTELTHSTFSIKPIKGSGTVLEDRSDRLELSNFGKTIPDGTPATVRFITADGGTTTVILRTPNAPPSDGDVSLLWQSPSGNPASGSGTATATATPTPTPTPSSPQLTLQWTYSTNNVEDVEIDTGGSLYAISNTGSGTHYIEEIDTADGSRLDRSGDVGSDPVLLRKDSNDKAFYRDPSTWDLVKWDPSTNTTSTIIPYIGEGVRDYTFYNGDIEMVRSDYSGSKFVQRRQTDDTVVWNNSLAEFPYSIESSSTGVYVGMQTTIEKWTHAGSSDWTTNIGSTVHVMNAENDTYLYVFDQGDKLSKLYQSNGTITAPSYTTGGRNTVGTIDIGPENYIYIDDNKNVTILDPADLTVVHQRQFSSEVNNVDVVSDMVYLTVNNELKKFSVAGLP